MTFWLHPSFLLTKTRPLLRLTLFVTLALWGLGLTLALWLSPPDYQQGEAMRMMYIHVPASWLALGIYTLMALGSAAFLVWRLPLGDLIAAAAAPLGVVFTLISLITGAIWGKPTWGTWWVWDARLTSMLILFFLYMGYMGLRQSFNDSFESQKPAAYLALIGWINIPIIKGSVAWWHTLHQGPSVFRLKGPALPVDMLLPLFVMVAAFGSLFLLLFLLNLRLVYLRRKIEALQVRLSCRF